MRPKTDGFGHIKILVHIIFLFSGVMTVLIGPLLPVLERNFALNDLQLSYFFPTQFAGSLTGTFLTNLFGRRGKFVQAAMIGSVLMASGILLMNFDSFAACLGGFFLNGLGIGLTLPSINMLILEINPTRSAAALSVLNFCWGIGAIFSKPFVDYLSFDGKILWVTLSLAVPLMLASAVLFVLASKQKEPTHTAPDDTEEPSPAIWKMPAAWAIAAFNFIHVGFESGMGGWLAVYSERVETASAVHFITPTFLYFLFFVAGRGTAPFFFKFLSENSMLLASLIVTLAGMVIALSADDLFTLGIGASIAGFGTSTIFPTNLSRFSNTFGPQAMKHATPFFILGTLGSASTTWLIGFFSNQFGNLRSGMVVLAVSLVLLIILQTALGISTKKDPALKV